MPSRSLLATFWTLLIPIALSAQNYSIKTVAGGPPTDNVAGKLTGVGVLTRVVVDSKGNAFFSDAAQHAVLRLDTASGLLTNVAGNGTRGFSGDGGAATSAQLSAPGGVAVDAAGNLYIADTGNHRIRKVANGVITTIAGTGTAGFTGDGAAALAAQLNSPRAVTVDSSGSIYVADTGNNRIRQIQNGNINTVAGGGPLLDNAPATKAALNSPQDVAVDAGGNLYITDPGNYMVHKVQNGTLLALAGNQTFGNSGNGGPAAAAQLSGSIGGVSVDANGAVYIADTGNQQIRKVVGGIITLVAGSGLADFSGDGVAGPDSALNNPVSAVADAAGNVFIADQGNARLRKLTNGIISTVAGGGSVGDGGSATSAKVFGPAGVALDSSGNLYVAEQSGNRVRKVTSGAISTVAGNGVAGVSGNFGLATGAELNGPADLAVDGFGYLYILDAVNQTVRRVASGAITTVAGAGMAGFNGDGISAVFSQLSNPAGIAVDPTGTLYIADGGNHRIRKVSGGIITTIAGTGIAGAAGDLGPASSTQVYANGGIAIDSLGNIYFGDSGNYKVRKISNGIISTVAGNGLPGTQGDGGQATNAQIGGGLLKVTADSAGNLYIADVLNHRIRKVSNGIITTIAGTGTPGEAGDGGSAATAQLDLPSAVVVDNAGNVYVADAGGNRVRMLQPLAAITITGVSDNATLGPKITPGMPVAVSGTGFGPGSGDSAVFTIGGKPAPTLSHQTPNSITIQVPADLPVGPTTITAIYKGNQSTPFPLALVQYAPQLVPAVFFVTGTGLSQGFFGDATGNAVSASRPAGAYAEITCTAIGLGPTNPAMVAGVAPTTASPTVAPVTVFVGGIATNPSYAGLSVGVAGGAYQVKFRVPTGLAAGSQPVTLSVGGVSSNAAPLFIGPAVPAITAIVNAATYKARGAAPNSFISIFGYNLGSLDSPSNLFPSTNYNGVSILFNGNLAPLYYVYGIEGQINLVLPSELATTGTVTVVVQNAQGSSLPFSLNMAPTDVGVFRIADPSNAGRNNGAVLFANTAWRVMPASMAQAIGFPDCTNATATTVCGQPARAGDSILLFVTGLGKATPGGSASAGPLPTGALAPADGSTLYQTVQTPVVTIGGVAAKVGFSGIAPGNAGLYQINVTVPTGVAVGDDVPVVITMPGGTSDTVTIAVRL